MDFALLEAQRMSARLFLLFVREQSTNQLIGPLTKKAKKYIGKFSSASNPIKVTVKSDVGGSDTAPVTGR